MDDLILVEVFSCHSNVSKLSFKPEEGAEVIATGKISTYAKSISVYQLNVENLELSGEGALLKLIEERKIRLMKKGLFDDETFIPYIFMAGFGEGYGGKVQKVDNELLGVKRATEADVEEILKTVIQG